MMLLSVYAQKMPNGDVLITRENGEKFARYDGSSLYKPTRRNKFITLNCYKWALVWKQEVTQ